MKSSDIAPELRQLNNVFSKFGGRWDYYKVFSDFLKYTIYAFNTGRTKGDIEWYENLKLSYDKYYNVFPEIFQELVLTYNRQIKDTPGSWYDPLGDLYMAIASKSKASAFGQFFTPGPVVDLMVQFNMPDGGFEEAKGKGYSVNDPTCGSARMLLAYHSLAPGNFMYGDDLDEICVNMSIVNMVFHGCVGQVRHMDSLLMKFYSGYAINPRLSTEGLISIRPLKDIDDSSWLLDQPNYWQRRFRDAKNRPQKEIAVEKQIETPAKAIIEPPKVERKEYKQLSLW